MRETCPHNCMCGFRCQPDCKVRGCGVEDIPGEAKMTSKDPNSYIQASAETLAETLSSKNHDYAPSGEFSNFEKAAEIAGTNAMIVMTAQAAIKMTRIQSLMDPRAGTYENESLKDSFLDLAGYALIAHAYLSANEPVNPVDPFGTPDPHWLVRDEG